MAEAVAQRLAAVAQLLKSVHKLPCFMEVSAHQAQAVAAAITGKTFQIDDANRLVEQAQQIPWAFGEHAAMVVGALAVREGPQSANAVLVRRRPQDFEAFTNYVTSSLWASMQEEKPWAMENLCSHLRALGLRNPTETTVQKATGILMLATEGPVNTLNMPPQTLHEILKATKKMVRLKAVQQESVDVQFVQVLPCSPDQFRASWPSVHEAVFKAEGPVSCPFSAGELLQVCHAIPMRSSRRAMAVARLPSMLPGMQGIDFGALMHAAAAHIGMQQQQQSPPIRLQPHRNLSFEEPPVPQASPRVQVKEECVAVEISEDDLVQPQPLLQAPPQQQLALLSQSAPEPAVRKSVDEAAAMIRGGDGAQTRAQEAGSCRRAREAGSCRRGPAAQRAADSFCQEGVFRQADHHLRRHTRSVCRPHWLEGKWPDEDGEGGSGRQGAGV